MDYRLNTCNCESEMDEKCDLCQKLERVTSKFNAVTKATDLIKEYLSHQLDYDKSVLGEAHEFGSSTVGAILKAYNILIENNLL